MSPSSVQAMSNEALLAIHVNLDAEIDAAQKPLEHSHVDLSSKKRERLLAKDELRRRGVLQN